MDVEERTSIYDFKGKSMGDLSVEIKVFADEACTQRLDNVEMDDGVEDELSMLLNQKIFISVTVEEPSPCPSGVGSIRRRFGAGWLADIVR